MPGDDMQQPGLLFDEAVKYAQFIFLCGDLGNLRNKRPLLNLLPTNSRIVRTQQYYRENSELVELSVLRYKEQGV